MNNWYDLEFFHSEKFNKIVHFLKEEKEKGITVLPSNDNILNAFYYTPFDQVKVVILGQDPYPTIGHPIGLAFAVDKNVKPLPKSLINIFKELNDDLNVKKDNGDLTEWAKQGVLLLNTTLTVRAGIPGSHATIGWGILIKEVINSLNMYKNNIVFVLWGKHAQQYEMFIDKTKHYIVKSAHPSPLSASRGFFKSRPFSKINKYLKEKNIKQIIW